MSLEISMENITQFINEYELADEDLLNELFNFLYEKIHSLANSQLRKLNPDHSLSPTLLVNECYIKIRSSHHISLKDRNHFYSMAARCMRFFLVDLVRQSVRQKNKGFTTELNADEIINEDGLNLKLLEMDLVLEQLYGIDKNLASITELKIFGGFTFDEIAEIFDTTRSNIYKKWTVAKSYILNIIAED